MTMSDWPPSYSIRVSDRARYISLQVSPRKGLEIIVPRYTSHKSALEFLHSKRSWVEKHLQSFSQNDTNQNQVPKKQLALPNNIYLQAINKSWAIEYLPRSRSSKAHLSCGNETLFFYGQFSDFTNCRLLTHRWLKGIADEYLTPWLTEIATRCALTFNRVSYRAQKTRWGSCSAKKDISLNYKLLFLPKDYVDYVMIHELCHTIHLNHSKHFWKLVESHQANYREIILSFRQAQQFIPDWVEAH